MPVLDPLSLDSGIQYRIVTLGDLDKEPVAKQGKKTASGAALDEGVEPAGGRKRKVSKQKMDEDGEYHDEDDEDTHDCANETRAVKNKRQKRGDGERDAVDGDDYNTLTPRQMVALHWAGQDAGGAAAKSKQAEAGKEQTDDGNASQSDGAKERDGAEVKVGTESAGPVTGKLRNGKKRDIGRRLGGG